MRTIEAIIGGHNRKIAELNTQQSDAKTALRVLDERESALVDVAQLIRGNVAKAGIDEAERALAQNSTWRDQAQQHRNEAMVSESTLEGITLPTVSDLDSLTRLEHQLQIARAGLASAYTSRFGQNASCVWPFDGMTETLKIASLRTGNLMRLLAARSGLISTMSRKLACPAARRVPARNLRAFK